MDLKELVIYIHQQALVLQEKIVFGRQLEIKQHKEVKTNLETITKLFEDSIDIVNKK